ncbi:MAG: hypothetical protein C0592_03830 [Marinilabiliales bacterium]|nr:MAG: hypothetical protein C0592_03830 [Marinilabiliales bacterium]
MDFPWNEFVILPLLIFLARIADQTVGSLRLIFLARGFKLWAPIMGFFEVTIWLLAAGQIINDLSNWIAIFAYGAGFAVGNYLGMRIDEKLSMGTVVIRLIPKKDTAELAEYLSAHNFGLTSIDASGSKGDPVKILLSIIKRKDLPSFIDAVNQYNPGAFYTIEDIRAVSDGVFRNHTRGPGIFNLRKGK